MPRLASSMFVAMLLGGCASGREVMRLRSPDGRIDAVLLERAQGARADYEVRVEPVDPADGRPGWIIRIPDVPKPAECPRPYAMRWEMEPGPSGEIRWIDLAFMDGGDGRLAVPPPSFRSGTVLARYRIGSPEARALCGGAPH